MATDAELTAALQEVTTDDVVDPIDAEVEVVEEVEEVEEEIEEEVAIEDVEELLPTDHKERSDLGRKVAALLKKTDKTDEVLWQLASVIERLTPKEAQELDEEENLYVTKRELKEIVEKPSQEARAYENDFKKAFLKMSEIDGLSEEETEAIAQITLEKYNKPFTGDAKLDGAMNYSKAKEDYLSSKKKVVPVLGKKAPGVITKQVSQQREAKKTKLDQASESLLAFIERADGAEHAAKVRKAI